MEPLSGFVWAAVAQWGKLEVGTEYGFEHAVCFACTFEHLDDKR